MHLTYTLAILTVVGFFAGFVDSIAGGGGLIALPALLGSGMSPAMALGTNKFMGAAGELSAIWQYAKHQSIDFKKIFIACIYIIISSSIGAILVQALYPQALGKIIPFLLLGILLYLSIPRKKSDTPTKARLREKSFYLFIGSAIGFYNGFFGPGTGTFWTAALMFFLAYDLRQAIVYTKPLNFAGNVIAVVWFIVLGNVAFLTAICMSVGSITGARMGSSVVIYRELKLIRPLFITLVSLMTVGLFIKYYF